MSNEGSSTQLSSSFLMRDTLSWKYAQKSSGSCCFGMCSGSEVAFSFPLSVLVTWHNALDVVHDVILER